MDNELFLKQPTDNPCRITKAWWQNLSNPCPRSGVAVRENNDSIIALQWLVAIAISYLVFAVQDWNLTDPGAGLLIIICLVSALILQRIPERIFHRGYIEPALLILDSLLVVSAMILREQTPWDLLLLFFFCVFIAAIGENLIQVGVASLLLSLVFLLFASPNGRDALRISPDLLVRVPFMFGISIFYGYMASQVKKEKKRMEQLEEAVRLKRQFLSALAHDIKTPLNVILGHAELLAGEYGGQPDPTERLSSLKRIRENIDRIVQLVTDFLAVSKLETVGLQAARQLVQMNGVAEDVVLQQMVIARDKNLKLTLDLDKNLKPVMGDNNQLQRALWNLVANAIKFTPSGGRISLRSRMVGNNISVKVIDSGPGIPKEELPRLFSEFKRLKTSTNTEGTGLGLFIVKTIVEAHNGTVSVESDEGVGSTFTILLPPSKNSLAPIRPNLRANDLKLKDLWGAPHSSLTAIFKSIQPQ
jgi:signal transduction histidine kinase